MEPVEPAAKRARRAPTGGNDVLRTRRPRALDADLIRYFRQLEVTLVSFKEEAAAGGGTDHSEMLVAAALREMKNSEASAASHKHCSHVVEKLLSIASGLALRQFMHNAAGFALHMCTNRYASHVVQVMLKRASKLLFAPVVAASSEAEDEDAPPPMAELIASFCGELEQDWATVIQDPSGSHAARTLLELLRGDGGRDGSAAAAVSSIVTPLPSPAAEILGGIVPSICDNILQLGWSTLRKIASTHHSGGTLTLLVEALSAHQRQLRSLRINLLSDSRQTPSEALVKLTSYASGSRVMESLVRVSSFYVPLHFVRILLTI